MMVANHSHSAGAAQARLLKFLQSLQGSADHLAATGTRAVIVALMLTALLASQHGHWHARPQLPELPPQPTLEQLRVAGEALAGRFPGLAGMGMGMVGQDASAAPRKLKLGGNAAAATYRPVTWPELVQSCTPEASGGKVVLVTGAVGFIGMHVAIALRERGDGVVGLDNLNDYYPTSLKRARQLNAEAAGVYTAEGDLNDLELLRGLFAACNFTHIVHLAAQAGVRYAALNPYSYVHSNLGGQVALLEVSKEQQPAPPAIVYASSSSVYGLNTKTPFSEEDSVDTPASLYAATKRADELIAHVYHNIYGLSLTGLRFFTVYGPWGRPDMATYSFAVKIVKGEPLGVFKAPDGSELSRDFTYIEDVVTGVMAAVDTAPPSLRGQASNRLFNLGNHHPHTVSELVGLLEQELGLSAQRQYVPVPPTGDVLNTFANVSHAQQQLGYQPHVGLDQGVARFADWFRQYYATPLEGGAPPPDWSYLPL